jgi:hypothetical protein
MPPSEETQLAALPATTSAPVTTIRPPPPATPTRRVAPSGPVAVLSAESWSNAVQVRDWPGT